MENNRNNIKQVIRSEGYLQELINKTQTQGILITNVEPTTNDEQKEGTLLGAFYQMVALYANQNYIDAINCTKKETTTSSYILAYQNNYYKLSKIDDNKITYYSFETGKEAINQTISFADIQKGKKTLEAEIIDEKLEKLDMLIRQYYREGLPVDAIEKTVEDSVGLIKICRKQPRRLL